MIDCQMCVSVERKSVGTFLQACLRNTFNFDKWFLKVWFFSFSLVFVPYRFLIWHIISQSSIIINKTSSGSSLSTAFHVCQKNENTCQRLFTSIILISPFFISYVSKIPTRESLPSNYLHICVRMSAMEEAN